MIKLSIVFPVFNGLSYTKACLAEIEKQTAKTDPGKLNIDIVVTDDGSTDGTSAWIREHYPNVHLIQGDGTLWWSGGINRAIRFALDELKADYTLWWNNDVTAGETFFTQLAGILQTQKSPAVIGSKVKLLQHPETIWSMGGIFNPVTGRKYMIAANEPDSEQYSKPVECDWLTGMGTVVAREVYEKIGMIDEVNFPQYDGDSDFTFRAVKAGFRVTAHPALVIYNDTSQTGMRHQDNFRKFYQSLISTRSNYNFKKDVRFYRKHATSPGAYKVLMKRYVSYIGGFFKWKLLGLLGKKRNHKI